MIGNTSKPGGAGSALVFADHVVKRVPFRGFPKEELTFEAWVSTSDYCNSGTLFSYAVESHSRDYMERQRAYNTFVAWNVNALIACHDFNYLMLVPDYYEGPPNYYQGCKTFYGDNLANFVDRKGTWHHVAITWNAKTNGTTRIYFDGLLISDVQTARTQALPDGGAFLIGGEQDCYGGCTESTQAFYGLMDEVRLWSVERSQKQIQQYMRNGHDVTSQRGLVGYWKFDDASDSQGQPVDLKLARDASGNNNALTVKTYPVHAKANINGRFRANALEFSNNYAINTNVQDIPEKDVTVEFWAKTASLDTDKEGDVPAMYEFFSFATTLHGDGDTGNDGGHADSALLDDGILIEKYLTEYRGTNVFFSDMSTRGAVSVHINANREGNGGEYDSWIDFDTQWTDGEWHHIAVTWEYATGITKLFFDGEEKKPFWKSSKGRVEDRAPAQGGVDPSISANVLRQIYGSLVLGQNQECVGGCFKSSTGLDGSLAELRIWNRALDQAEIEKNMYMSLNDPPSDVRVYYKFDPSLDTSDNNALSTNHITRDMSAGRKNDLLLDSIAPTWVYSTAPLAGQDGMPLPGPTPGSSGYSLKLHDQQVAMVTNFEGFPSRAITVEFWMRSVDRCAQGTPVSYALGDYGVSDNAFLIVNYQSWAISIMEDEGTLLDHYAGVGATDGTWHHIAVTWESSSGKTVLYDNGKPIWRVQRAKGATIPSGGTLVIGREQDCAGGCFDSNAGAVGNSSRGYAQEYGPQDFFGEIENLRIWRVARTEEDIVNGMLADSGLGAGKFDIPGVDASHPDLVAYWKFDEGAGYTAHDEKGHHHLHLSEDPEWVVVPWLSECGNGYVEGSEMCDDGNLIDGDGCSSSCQVESGWTCTGANPSVCTKSSTPDGGGSSGADPHQTSGGSSHASGHEQGSDQATKGGKRSAKGWLGVTVLSLAVLSVCVLGYMKREVIQDTFPEQYEWVAEKVESVISKVTPSPSRPMEGDAYAMLSLDAEDASTLSGPVSGYYSPPTQ